MLLRYLLVKAKSEVIQDCNCEIVQYLYTIILFKYYIMYVVYINKYIFHLLLNKSQYRIQ